MGHRESTPEQRIMPSARQWLGLQGLQVGALLGIEELAAHPVHTASQIIILGTALARNFQNFSR